MNSSYPPPFSAPKIEQPRRKRRGKAVALGGAALVGLGIVAVSLGDSEPRTVSAVEEVAASTTAAAPTTTRTAAPRTTTPRSTTAASTITTAPSSAEATTTVEVPYVETPYVDVPDVDRAYVPAPVPFVAPVPAPVPYVAPAPYVEPEPYVEAYVPEPASSAYYENCTAARNAGAAPVYAGSPGYGSHLDRDGDGVGCES